MMMRHLISITQLNKTENCTFHAELAKTFAKPAKKSLATRNLKPQNSSKGLSPRSSLCNDALNWPNSTGNRELKTDN